MLTLWMYSNKRVEEMTNAYRKAHIKDTAREILRIRKLRDTGDEPVDFSRFFYINKLWQMAERMNIKKEVEEELKRLEK